MQQNTLPACSQSIREFAVTPQPGRDDTSLYSYEENSQVTRWRQTSIQQLCS
jgi:hypothetical protein